MKRKLNQAGFSLVEFIIVMGIIGILAGVSTTLLSRVRFANTQKTVEEISSSLHRHQVTSMSKGKTYLYIYSIDGAYYMCQSATKYDAYNSTAMTKSGKELGAQATIYYSNASGTKTKLTGTDIIRICYKRNGAFDDDNTTTNIYVEGRGKYQIQLIKNTGKHIVKNY